MAVMEVIANDNQLFAPLAITPSMAVLASAGSLKLILALVVVSSPTEVTTAAGQAVVPSVANRTSCE